MTQESKTALGDQKCEAADSSEGDWEISLCSEEGEFYDIYRWRHIMGNLAYDAALNPDLPYIKKSEAQRPICAVGSVLREDSCQSDMSITAKTAIVPRKLQHGWLAAMAMICAIIKIAAESGKSCQTRLRAGGHTS